MNHTITKNQIFKNLKPLFETGGVSIKAYKFYVSIFAFLLLITSKSSAQSYNLTFAANAGNPAPGYVTTDISTAGTIVIDQSLSANVWSSVQTLPFPFTFYGVPVTQYKVSANGVLTFDVASAILPAGNVSIPTPNLPDLSIAFMWDEFTAAPPTAAGDRAYANTYGTAPNRQHWVWFYSYEIGNPQYSFAYWAVVLEESTNNIYVIDQYSIAGTSGTTVGVQLNSTTGIQDPLSPNIARQGNGTTLADNDVWTFQYLTAPCNGVPAVGTATGPSEGCPSTNITVTVTGTTPAVGLTYQWQSSPDGFSWTDIPGATSTSYAGTITAPLNYRRMDICTNTSDTSYSTPHFIDVSPFFNCYCTSGATSPSWGYIKRVALNTINNVSPSGCGQQYTDNTSIQTNLFEGLSYNISLDIDNCSSGTYNYGTRVWIDFNQNGIFDATELVYDGYPVVVFGTITTVNGTISIPVGTPSGLTRMRVVTIESNANPNPCGTFTWGETEDYLVNILPPPANEAGVLAISKPELSACALGQEIWVEMQNLGTNDLTSATFTVTVNGFNIPTQPWTGLVPAQSTAEVQVPVTYVLADGDSINVSVSNPNGVTEDTLFAFNNQTGRRVWAGLSGVKSVYGAGADFANMDDAVAALVFRGVCDTVYFQIANGDYASNHIFEEYPGAGPGRLAVFESASGNASDVIFRHSAIAAADNYVFRFDGGDGYMVRNLTGIAEGTAFSKVVDILNGADDLTFESNVFVGDTVSAYNASDFNRIVIASSTGTGSTDLRTVIRDNHIIGGNRGINLGAATGSFEFGTVIEGNLFENYGHIGVILGGQQGSVIKNNVFRPKSSFTQDAFGPYLNGCVGGGEISGNDYLSNRTGSGIFLTNVKGGIESFVVTNNFVYSGDTNTTGVSRGILIQDVNSNDILVANNSISFHSDNATSGAITVVDGVDIRFYNNNVGAFGTAPAARIEKSYSVIASDNNNMFGTNLANVLGSVYTTLASFQSATGFDANSVSVNPGFNGTDLHTCAPELNGAAMPLASVTVDFDGDVRSATPDIGADEFVGDANGLLAADYFEKCPSVAVTLGNAPQSGVTYSWTPSGNTSEITVTAAGTYVVTATSACGSFSDTVVVVNNPLPTASFTSTSVGLASIFTNTSTNGTSYLWDFGDGNTSTEFSPTHVYSSAGVYSANLTVTNECGSATFGPQPVNVINAGIEENDMASVSLFPNPTSGQFTVTLNNISSETVLTVIDVTGKAVLVKNVPAGVNQITLDATSFASGVYSVKVSSGDFNKVIRLVRK